jgi:hypothetical protein
MADKTIAELAPTLVAAGLAEEEILEKVTAEKKPAAPYYGEIQPKRWREALALLVDEPHLTDAQIAARVPNMLKRPELVTAMRAEVAALKANPNAKPSAQQALKEAPIEEELKP